MQPNKAIQSMLLATPRSVKNSFRVLVVLFGLAIIPACSVYQYNVSAKQGQVVNVNLEEISKSESSRILQAYFKKYPYDQVRNKNVLFLCREAAENCLNQLCTMVWVWDVSPMLSCSQAIDVFKSENDYMFEMRNERCLF